MSKLTVKKVPSIEDRKLPIFDEFNEIADKIRVRAFNLFANRGFDQGNDLDDWLTAEREIGWPAAELVEKDDKFEVKVALAGFGPDDLSVTANPRELMVKASRKDERKETEDKEGVKVRWSEFSSNDVYRHIDFPADVEVDEISADFKNGILEVEAPKAEQKSGGGSQKVEVTSS